MFSGMAVSLLRRPCPSTLRVFTMSPVRVGRTGRLGGSFGPVVPRVRARAGKVSRSVPAIGEAAGSVGSNIALPRHPSERDCGWPL